VREKERAKKQHYHLVLFLYGNKIQHPKKINAKIKVNKVTNAYVSGLLLKGVGGNSI
jgi:hypothetical protein